MKNNLIRFARLLFALRGIKIPIRLYMKLRKMNMTPAVIDTPPGRNILVLAPHMDDETIGCGGTLIRHIRAGARITVVFITDGGAGYRKGDTGDDSAMKEGICEIRRNEARDAASILGYEDMVFLDLPDSKVEATDSATEKLAAVFERVRPDLVYLPFMIDTHHDHWVTNDLFVSAMRKLGGNFRNITCCGYEVWNPILPNCVVDISEVIDIKRNALEQYESQLAINNYISSILGLNAYRAIVIHSKGYAEAFFMATLREYLDMYDQMWA